MILNALRCHNKLSRFSELALLLPNTDIDLIVFGHPGANLVRQARKQYPGSIAANEIVWNYTAPRKCGGGSVNIKINSENGDWTRDTISYGEYPHAIVGLNAGISSYPSWGDPVIFSTVFVIKLKSIMVHRLILFRLNSQL